MKKKSQDESFDPREATQPAGERTASISSSSESAEAAPSASEPSQEPPPTATTGPTPAPSGGSQESEPRLDPHVVLAERYEIRRFVARGGMGEVYEAQDLSLHERVALKTIRPDADDAEKAIDRFKREIQLARKISHPNVCRIHDLGTHREPAASPGAEPEQLLFLTMELLDGESLSGRLRRLGRLDLREALSIVEQMAAALDAAHSVGVIHRDFKSSNVMLVPGPAGSGLRAVVTDFGLARAGSGTGPDAASSLTEKGMVVGTPAYMAPEQVLGEPLTPAADVYAMGVVLFEMVVGTRPFHGDSAMGVAVKRLTQPPPSPRSLVPDLPEVWESAILRCLERDPTQRCSRAGAIVPMLRSGAPAASDPTLEVRGDELTRTTSATPTSVPAVSPERQAPESEEADSRARTAVTPTRVGLAAAVVVAGLALWSALGEREGGVGAGELSDVPAAPVESRRSLAVMGLRNLSGRADDEWLGTAIAEMLTTDLGADQELRLVGGDEVARVSRDLELARRDSLSAADLQKIGQNTGVDYVVSGSYALTGGGNSRMLRLDTRLLDTSTGGVLSSSSATGVEAQLFELISRAGSTLRGELNLGDLSPDQVLSTRASLPQDPAAARAYAEGLAKLRVADAQGARAALLRAIELEPEHPMPHAALASAWTQLGYDGEAADAATRAAEHAGSLPESDRLLIQARLYQAQKNWPRAIESYQQLYERHPDDVDHGLRLAETLTLAGRAQEALVTVASLRRLPPAVSGDPRLDLAEARAHQEMGEFADQLRLASAAATRAREMGARQLEAQARMLEATALQNTGRPDEATAAIDEARGLFEQVGDDIGVARTLEVKWIVLWRQGDLSGSLRLLDGALELYEKIGNRRGTARVLQRKGFALMDQGELVESEKLLEEALTRFRDLGADREAGDTLNAMGLMSLGEGDLEGALARYQETLSIFSQLNEKGGIAIALTNIAEIHFIRGELAEARRLHEEALALDREIGEKSGEAYDTFALGDVFTAQGDLRVARRRYEEALEIQNEIEEHLAAAETRISLARLALAEGQAARAEEQARAAEEVFRVEGASDLQARALAPLVHALILQKKLAEAREANATLQSLAKTSSERRVQMAAVISRARLAALASDAGERDAATRALEELAGRAAKEGFAAYDFEARLVLGELELTSGDAARGRQRLEALAEEAKSRGLGLVQRRARQLISEAADR